MRGKPVGTFASAELPTALFGLYIGSKVGTLPPACLHAPPPCVDLRPRRSLLFFFSFFFFNTPHIGRLSTPTPPPPSPQPISAEAKAGFAALAPKVLA